MANPDHTAIRLEHPTEAVTGSTVVAYLAPNFEAIPSLNNDLMPEGGTPMPRSEPMRVRDRRIINEEITVQGEFHDTHDPETGTPVLPTEHISDLQSVFGQEQVTARDQVNRVIHYLHMVGGPYHLYIEGSEYTAQSVEEVDPRNGINMNVQVQQFRPPSMGGHSNFEYVLKCKPGKQR